MFTIKESLQLYFVMGSSNCNKDPREVLNEAIKGGVTLYQFREKGDNCFSGKERISLAEDLQKICREANIPFIINDDVGLALELDADGVHIGQEDQPIAKVREMIGNKILGVSSHTVEEAKIAVECGADYLGVGPMYSTTTKKDIREVQGPKVIKNIRAAGINHPIVGIGGINESRAAEVIRSGANGVAVISAISKADFPQEAAQCLKERIRNLINKEIMGL